MTRSHTRNLEATKEIFYPFLSAGGTATDSVGLGGHTGFRINADDEYAYCECYIPWDFEHLTEGKIALLALETLTPMTLRVVTDYCQNQTVYFQHNNLQNFEINTFLNRVHECDISPALIALTNRAPLEAKDYLGVQVARIAGMNTNAIFLGVRIRYNTPTYARAP